MKHILSFLCALPLILAVPAHAQSATALAGTHPGSLAGTWRIYSERLYYDIGGGGPWASASQGSAGFRTLVIHGNGTYEFGSSRGSWSVEPIQASDWKTWKVGSYGPSQKIVLQGWNKAGASGPLEGSGSRADFVWVIYRVAPPLVRSPGTVYIKFGH